MKKAWIILAALIAGLLIGMAVGDRSPLFHDAADVVGTIWLNGLRMTVIPLVVALLITGIVQTANAASAGRTATRSVITMISILVLVTIMAAIVTPTLLALFPLDPDAAQALRQAMGAVEPAAAPPPFSEFLKAVVPTNPFQAAASDALLPARMP